MGERIGRYELIRHLASGGMAEVFLAKVGNPGTQKFVVLKRVLPRYARKAEYTTMFLDEARLGAMLSHPNIAKVHEVGYVDDNYFMAMEYMKGRDLSHLMERVFGMQRRFPLAATTHIISRVCAGLHYAHERSDNTGASFNVVHRDVSPQNIFVTYDGEVKLIDFGLAKAVGRTTETQVGRRKGKVAYMSPEQARAKEIDRRADVFSTAVVLWELITARRLFDAPDEIGILQLILREEIPPPSRFIPNVDPELERIIMLGLERDADKRYPTAEAFRLDLEAFIQARGLEVSSEKLGGLISRISPAPPPLPGS